MNRKITNNAVEDMTLNGMNESIQKAIGMEDSIMSNIKKLCRAIADSGIRPGMYVTVDDDTTHGRVYIVGNLYEEEEDTRFPEWRKEFISLKYIDDTWQCKITHYHITKIRPFNGSL